MAQRNKLLSSARVSGAGTKAMSSQVKLQMAGTSLALIENKFPFPECFLLVAIVLTTRLALEAGAHACQLVIARLGF